jgi:hypothetical protein
MKGLKALSSTRKTGDEQFHFDGIPLKKNLLSFWQWSSSELLSNAQRGVLAEFLVASDLGCVFGVREEWASYDIETLDGIKVEVKSAAYLQSWTQKKLSSIKFNIKKTFGWDSNTATFSEQKNRQADVYVFCVLNHTDKKTVNPMNLVQWDFLVLPTSVLNRELGEQLTITLSRLKRLKHVKAKYGEIGAAINQAMRAI